MSLRAQSYHHFLPTICLLRCPCVCSKPGYCACGFCCTPPQRKCHRRPQKYIMEKIFKFAPSNTADASYRAPSFHVLARAGDHHSESVSRTNFYGYATKQLWYTGASDSLPVVTHRSQSNLRVNRYYARLQCTSPK